MQRYHVLRNFVVLLFTVLPYIQSACHFSCQTCSIDNSATNCMTCNEAAHHRSLTASNTCECMIQYAEPATSNSVCDLLTCDHSCPTTCKGTTTNCTSCSSAANREQIGSTCPCKPGYFDDGTN